MTGYLEITFGPMFSGKTTNLLEKINNFITFNNLKGNKLKILIINSKKDDRKIETSHNLTTHMSALKRNLASGDVESIKVDNLFDIDKQYLSKFSYIAIDEAQFFSDLQPFVKEWIKIVNYIHCVGLLADTDKNNFGSLYKILCMADNVEQLKAFCIECQNYSKNAVFTKWIGSKNKESIIEIGDSKTYVPVCGKHY